MKNRERCSKCKWRTAVGCPSRTGQACAAWETGDSNAFEKFVTMVLVSFVAGAMAGSHVTQGLRNEITALESAQKEMARQSVTGWWHIDPVTMQLCFVGKR